MRGQEGGSLALELGASMERLDLAVSQVAKMRHEVQKAYFERISQRIAGLLNGNAGVDRDRLLQEAAMLAERSDVEEEVTRLRTPIQHFQSLLRTYHDAKRQRPTTLLIFTSSRAVPTTASEPKRRQASTG